MVAVRHKRAERRAADFAAFPDRKGLQGSPQDHRGGAGQEVSRPLSAGGKLRTIPLILRANRRPGGRDWLRGWGEVVAQTPRNLGSFWSRFTVSCDFFALVRAPEL